MGNIQSVCNAFDYLDHETLVITNPGDLDRVDKILIPGVGAFPAAMEMINQTGFAAALDEQVLVKGKYVLGICLGMQLLAEEGIEFERCRGLGWIPGRVDLIPRHGGSLRLPHVGWNELEAQGECPLLRDIGSETSCYFVHSYQLRVANENHITATVDYGGPVTAAVAHNNIFGVQFHPEKSQRVGLGILDNFARL
jgi:glutamine amidotransferase